MFETLIFPFKTAPYYAAARRQPLLLFRTLISLPYSLRITSPPSLIMSHHDVSNSTHPLAEMNKTDDTSESKQEAVVRRPARRGILNVAAIHKHLGYEKSRQQPNASATASNNTDCSLSALNNQSSVMDKKKQAISSTSEISVSCSGKPERPSVVDADNGKECDLPSVNCGWSLSAEQSKCSSVGDESLQDIKFSPSVDLTHMLEEHSLPTSFGKHPYSRKPKSIKNSLRNDGCNRNKDPKNESNNNPKNQSCTPVEVFDIFQYEADDSMFLRSSVDFLGEVKELEFDKLSVEPRERVLRPGMILLKSYITYSEQVSIVTKCRELGICPGGFYQPGYKYGAKLRLHMMCLGLDWDPQTRKYQKRRRIDRSKPHDIPSDFHRLVDRAMLDSLALIRRELKVSNAEDILPQMNPDICIVNFYSEAGRLGLHQDRDESTDSLTKGLPVVSFSLGDSAEFLYGDKRDTNKAEKLILESGDVLIFGGQSRHVFHGVDSIIPNSAPRFLLEETGLRPGRLNLTFRQY